MSSRIFFIRMALTLSVAAGLAAVAEAEAPNREFTPEDYEFFEKKIRPALAENCFSCHGQAKQKANLRLDSAEAMLKGSDAGPVLVPGDPAKSRLVVAITYEDVDLQMPPKGKLADEVIRDITKWVEMGAPWPGAGSASSEGAPAKIEEFDLAKLRASHWAWHPIRAVDPPATQDTAWPRAASDKFILAKLEGEGLKPAPEAEKTTLLRRVYFDLIGLPPTPDEVKAFLADESPDAYDKVVDRLLGSQHFGERWARRWLDLVRFAESYGHEQDFPILHAWRYRDYVIRAFNTDVPYDVFLTEQIAGDLMEKPRLHPEEGFNESVIGTGFWLLGQGTHAPVDVRQDEADRIDNQLDVLGKAALGLTIACARCHDHKFDAISTRDYYSLVGFLQSSRRQYAPLDPGGKIAAQSSVVRDLVSRGAETASAEIANRAEAVGKDIAQYLRASAEALNGAWKPSDGVETIKPNVVFEDFQTRGFADWEVRGEGFGREPFATKEGDRFAACDGDRTGSLVSRPFPVERDHIRFRIAGDENPEAIGARLLIDGQSVRSATGEGPGRWRDVVWDVKEFAGRVARIEIFDASDKGRVNVDQIVFSQRPDGLSLRRPIAAVAEESGLKADRLEKWALETASSDLEAPGHPLAAWRRIALADGSDDADMTRRHREWAGASAKLAKERATREGEVVFAAFEGDLDGWFVTGDAFGSAPTKGGEWIGDLGPTQFAKAGLAHSALVARELRGVLRSPSFIINHDFIHYRIAGESALIRLVVDGYTIREFHPLLFRDEQMLVNTGGKFVWMNQRDDIGKYKGERAHIEIIDDNHGWVALDEVRFSNGDPIGDGPDPASMALVDPESLGFKVTRDRIADIYGEVVAAAMKSWSPVENKAEIPGASLARWAFERGLVDLGLGAVKLTLAAKEVDAESAKIPDPIFALALADGTPWDEKVFVRGSHKNAAELAPRRFLEAISGPDQPPITNGSGRLELARRILDPSDPLPARVMVNRVWAHLFGRGIVGTVDNFGELGERPTHPELLDYLADEFRDDGWSTKRLIRRLVLSSAYRMSSDATNPEAETKDPANLLVHRMRVRRLEGEAIRDAILAVSGRLDTKIFGEPVTVHMTEFMYNGRNEPKSGPVDGDGRRSIYTELRRNFLPPFLLTFDLPTPDSTVGRRTVSNVPGQALALLNDPLVIGQAEFWSKRVLKETEGEETWRRVERMFMEAFGRAPSDNEVYRALAFIKSQGEIYGLNPEEAEKDERVWADLGHALFTLKEFIFIG